MTLRLGQYEDFSVCWYVVSWCHNADESFWGFRRKIYDEYNDEDVELTKEESKIVQRILKGEAPHADFDPYAVRICFMCSRFLLMLCKSLQFVTF